jgi:hypothetical protein
MFSPQFFGIKATYSSFIIFQRAKLSTRSITALCWCIWRTFWRENAALSSPMWVLFLHDNFPAHRALATQKKLAYLGFHFLDHTICSPDLAPSDYHLFSGLKNNGKVTIFRPTRRSLLPWRLVGRAIICFFLSDSQNLEQRDKNCIEIRGEYVE